ncbi:probable E3 ubiquitin-protein ligase RHY1A isoform X1 [Impatiens glandulifera]|uniref:probable E3 ubiquitin-protein ligase RHY1A isoform X1 n=1 Tax=Impatiens glandulifera TaxID=253017 RepID=UPI001FB0FBF0|nr:probable E3 ubiquitin-protein ligase RHY1A isoform X1 [Impatiens glandulifera]XP_047335055.1 probable E3 ubiquitin-protein ligase RHY1A isoform X1 [Impatiens glandulifera]
MTSASELFYNRRSRIIRSTNTLDLPDDLSLQRTINGGHRRHHGNGRIDRVVDLNGGVEPFRRSTHSRVSSHRPSLLQERESFLIDEGTSQSASSIIANSEIIGGNRDRMRYTGNSSRLPGAVLLARERLVQRLRSVSVSGNRETNRLSSGVNHNQGRLADDLMFLDTSILENEISREWSVRPSVPDVLFVEMQTKRRPEGLSIEALCKLQSEVFTMSENCTEDEKWTAFRECSICLETFIDGEELTRLPCGHRFHTCCLYPWITTCGDCPNCRAGVVKSFTD